MVHAAAEAARLEVDWWRIHRHLQRQFPDGSVTTVDDLAEALATLYAHVYEVPVDLLRPAARRRAAAMQISDEWVADGARAGSPAITAERDELIAGYLAPQGGGAIAGTPTREGGGANPTVAGWSSTIDPARADA